MRRINGLLGLLFPLAVVGALTLSEAKAVQTLVGVVTNVAQFYRTANTGYHSNYAVRLEGLICWVDPAGAEFVFEDESGAIPIRGAVEGGTVKFGWRVRLEGECTGQRSGLGLLMLSQLLVVENDGIHPLARKSGSVWLRAGLNPVRAVWFNSRGDGVFDVSYEGPGIIRQPIPSASLFHSEHGTNIASGLSYRCWKGEWDFVPDFDRWRAVTNGIASGFNVQIRTRPELVALEWTGLLNVAHDGRYTFHTESDDGSLFFAGYPALRATRLREAIVAKARPMEIGKVLSDAEEFQRCEVVGEVAYVEENRQSLRMELNAAGQHMLVEVADAEGADLRLLRGSRVRATGICHGTVDSEGRKVSGYLWVTSWGDIETSPIQKTISEIQDPEGKLPQLTSIAQVRNLSSEALGQGYPARIRGVVTATFGSSASFVVQDADQGLYISVLRLPDGRGDLEIGDLCEVTGTTRAASWAPVIHAERVVRLGLGRLPEPLRPSWDQILNGSLDSQYVELEGIVTEVHPNGAGLLSRVGKVEIALGEGEEDWHRFEDALVRVRGCVLAVYDPVTRLAISGKIRFVQPSVTVDEMPPADPFALPPKQVGSLRSFDREASVFQRVKVPGQVVHARDGLYCVMQGKNGMRFFPKKQTSLAVGAQVEVVGLPDLSGPSPALREAVVRILRQSPLPEPQPLMGTNLLNGALDATLVRVESLVLDVSREAGQQVLELRTGPYVHKARLPANVGHTRPVRVGSLLALTGVYLGKGGNWAAGQDIESFDLALNSPADITLLRTPPWWTVRRLLTLAGGLAAVLLLALGWIRILHLQVEERTRQLAQQIQARQRVEQQRALEQERTRLARDLHDDLGGGLTEISMLGSLANDRALTLDRKAGYLHQMTEKARQLVGALDEIVWAVNPRYDTVSSLAGYCSLYAQRFLGIASLACRLEISESLPDWPIESKVRHSLFLAFKEALNNVVRHAGASEVCLLIKVEADELILAVRDNGRGMQCDTALIAGMDGLASMRGRMTALAGRCEIQSAPAQGTTVLFGVHLRKENHDQSSHR